MYFNEQLADRVGVNGAIILQNFAFWINLNKENKSNFKEGKHWTYITLKSLEEKFSFLTPDKIRYAISKLIDLGIIQKGNFNKTKYDRTLWYSFTDDSILEEILSIVKGNSQMESVISPLPVGGIPEPIPDIKTNIKTEVEEEPTLNETPTVLQNNNETTTCFCNYSEELKQELLKRGLSNSQILSVLNSHSINYIQDKIKLFDYLSIHNPKKMKNKARFLFMAIKDNWSDDGFELNKALKCKEKAIEQQQETHKQNQRLKHEYDKYIESECKKEFEKIQDDELEKIDIEIKKEINTPFYQTNKDVYALALETKRVNFVFDRIKDQLLSFDDFFAQNRVG